MITKKLPGKERGQALVLIALAIVGLAAMAGLVIDGGNAFLDRRNAQSAADSAALTAALARVVRQEASQGRDGERHHARTN